MLRKQVRIADFFFSIYRVFSYAGTHLIHSTTPRDGFKDPHGHPGSQVHKAKWDSTRDSTFPEAL